MAPCKFSCVVVVVRLVYVGKAVYRIVENVGGRKLWRIDKISSWRKKLRRMDTIPYW